MSPVAETLTILFADIGGSTALYEQVGDLEAHRRVAESLALMKDVVTEHHGALLRTVGDSSLASFRHCDDAFCAARDIQRQHIDLPLSVRVGFHWGRVIPDGGDVYGNAVNLAARVASFARIEEITATADSVDRLSPKHRSLATWIDNVSMKGLSEAVGIYRLQWRDQDTAMTVIASKTGREWLAQKQCAMTISSGGKSTVIDEQKPVLTLGRTDECDIAVEHDEASRQHATIEFSHGQFLLTDRSTNGTYILRDSHTPLFVRRDTVVLEGDGILGLGALIEHKSDFAVKYEIRYS